MVDQYTHIEVFVCLFGYFSDPSLGTSKGELTYKEGDDTRGIVRNGSQEPGVEPAE